MGGSRPPAFALVHTRIPAESGDDQHPENKMEPRVISKQDPLKEGSPKEISLENVVLSIFIPQPHHLSAALDEEALERGYWTCSFITGRWRPHGPSRLNRLILVTQTKHFLKSPAVLFVLLLLAWTQELQWKVLLLSLCNIFGHFIHTHWNCNVGLWPPVCP